MEKGKPASDFELLDDEERPVRLSDLRGKWVVLYFYPRDHTPGCTTEALEFSAFQPDFAAADAVVLGISPDTCASHRGFRIKHDLGVRLLSDPDHRVMTEYKAWGEKKLYGRLTRGVIRSTVLVDPAGRVALHWPRVRARGHAAVVLNSLRELRQGMKT
ncbi:MAG: peroxiredoxin [Acidobacteriota bacterium]|jgi:peroxiredoxin Q/BCP|nr:peroxiredoxin [Acidobacteriota bacterium]